MENPICFMGWRLQVACFFFDHVIVAGQSRKWSKLRSTVIQTHVRSGRRLVVGQVDDIRVHDTRVRLFFCDSFGHTIPPFCGAASASHALCPPTCSLRSRVVPSSERFMPFKTAFLPYLACSSSVAFCNRRSLSSAAASAAFFFSRAA